MARRTQKHTWIVPVGLAALFGTIGLVVSRVSAKSSLPPKPASTPGTDQKGLVGPSYITKYTAEALQIASLPSPSGPVMLCSYVPFASLDRTDLASAQAALQLLKSEHETAPESMYGQTGRRHIVKLSQRFFDPQTYKELPPAVLYSSDHPFQVPTSPDLGVPCG
jgi:hypothetical protein